MGYCISRQETLANGFRRVIQEQLDKAIAGLADDRDPVNGLHTARKKLKRIRAVLRLIRPGLSKEFFQAQNILFRDTGRLLSPLRDVHVQRETLEQLNMPASTVALAFGDQLARTEELICSDRAVRRKAHAMLKKVRADLPRWPLRNVDVATVSQGLRQVYKKVRAAYQCAAADTSAENLHEWRKRTKDMWYAFELLGEFNSRSTGKRCRRNARLSDYLGHDHDFFFIGENLRQEQLARPRSELHHIGRVIAKKRARLQRCALQLGEKIFDEKPKRFEKRMSRRLKKQGRRRGGHKDRESVQNSKLI